MLNFIMCTCFKFEVKIHFWCLKRLKIPNIKGVTFFYVKINCVLKYVLYLYIYINQYRYSTNIWFLQSKRKRKKKNMFIQRNVFKILIETLHFPGNNMQTTLCMVLMTLKYRKPGDSIYYMYKCKKLKIKIKR